MLLTLKMLMSFIISFQLLLFVGWLKLQIIPVNSSTLTFFLQNYR